MGFGEGQASGYALLAGASAAGLGYLLGGVSELGGKSLNKVLGKVLPSVDNAMARIALNYGGKIIAEGNEEALQAVLEPVFKKIALNIDADIDWEEAAYAWFLGALTSAGYGSAEVAVDLGKLYGIWDRDTAGKTLPSYDPVLLEGPGTAGPDTGRATLPNHAPVALGEPGRTGADTVRPALPEDTAVPFDQPLLQPDTQTPQHTPDTWTADLDPLLQEDTDLDADLWPEEDTAAKLRPEQIRPLYEAALREYLGKGTEQNAALDTTPDADKASLQETAPKPKEQIISELAPKISRPGITPGKATIEAQRLYADAERIFGPNADTVLEMYQSGQDPRKFLDGFRNAYLSGKMGSRAALKNSGVAAYLTEEQRKYAFELGEQVGRTVESEGYRVGFGAEETYERYRTEKNQLVKKGNTDTILDEDMRIPIEKLRTMSLSQQAEGLDVLLSRYTNKESRWKGTTIITPTDQMRGVMGRKHWDCSIELREDAGIKTVIHELLHARSASQYKELAYSRWKNIEEASVELFAREICKKNGIEYEESYSTIVAPLERIRNILALYEDSYDFAKALFETDLLKRYDCLRKKADLLISRGVLREHNVKILTEAIEVFKRKVG